MPLAIKNFYITNEGMDVTLYLECLKMRHLPFIIRLPDLMIYHYEKPVLQWDKAETI